MKSLLIGYALDFLIDVLVDLARRSESTIDDQLVDVIVDNKSEIVAVILEKVE